MIYYHTFCFDELLQISSLVQFSNNVTITVFSINVDCFEEIRMFKEFTGFNLVFEKVVRNFGLNFCLVNELDSKITLSMVFAS